MSYACGFQDGLPDIEVLWTDIGTLREIFVLFLITLDHFYNFTAFFGTLTKLTILCGPLLPVVQPITKHKLAVVSHMKCKHG